jgi:PAS domain S-box-containing protein
MNNTGLHISEWVASLDVRKPFYLAIINKEGDLTFTNSGFYTRFLSSPETMTHDGFFGLIHRGDLTMFKDLLIASSYQEEPVTAQIRIQNRFCRWVKWEVSCIRRDGQPDKFLCLGYDIADEIQLKKTRRILEPNYQTIVEDMNVGILLQGVEGEVISANQKAAEIFNTTLEELYSRKKISILGETTTGNQSLLPFEETPFAKTLRTGKVQTNAVCNIQLPGGRYRTLLCNSQPIFDQPEFPAQAVLSTFQDITREKKFESLLAKQKLKEQKRIAEAIIKAQEDERARIGHELHDNINQILASGQLYLNVLTKEIDDFQAIKEKTLEILQLAIEEVRVLSRDLVLPDLKKGGLVASIDDLVLDLRIGDLFQIEFTHSRTGELEQMSQSKKVTLFRIIQEQTKNIIKYSKAKQVKIALDLDIDRIRLEIRDDGQGFDPANTRKGLGLSNIFERSRLYDGNAILGTAPGKGCCIVVNIPFGCHPAIR